MRSNRNEKSQSLGATRKKKNDLQECFRHRSPGTLARPPLSLALLASLARGSSASGNSLPKTKITPKNVFDVEARDVPFATLVGPLLVHSPLPPPFALALLLVVSSSAGEKNLRKKKIKTPGDWLPYHARVVMVFYFLRATCPTLPPALLLHSRGIRNRV